MDIKISGHDFCYDITSMAMLFFPGEKINYVNKSCATLRASSILKYQNDRVISVSRVICKGKTYTSTVTKPIGYDVKNLVKQSFYKSCSKGTQIVSPWGILTGIRPLSVYSKLKSKGENADYIMLKDYFVSPAKISVLSEIYEIEKEIAVSNVCDVSVYVSIPFCPSKCSYCSFISVAATNKNNLLSEYFENLLLEIDLKSELIKKYSLNVRSIYIGGGTPGILNERQLEILLSKLNSEFSFADVEEICFELGRPETVTEEKLEILKKYNVTRLCINTQTTNDEILASINRKHNSNSYFDAVRLAKSYDFRSINTDLIAGLPDESYESFCRSLKDVIAADVDNITIHTLAIKKSSYLGDDKTNYKPVNDTVSKMLAFSNDILKNNNFSPYYIYRQKNCVSNGENIGYCKDGKICRYNVYMMEDIHSVIACGAGASTKIISGTKVDRIINVKYPMEYVNEFEKVTNNVFKTEQTLKAVLLND